MHRRALSTDTPLAHHTCCSPHDDKKEKDDEKEDKIRTKKKSHEQFLEPYNSQSINFRSDF